MTKKAHELEFISQINRDGSGTHPVSADYVNAMLTNPLMKDDDFQVYRLSITEDTYIAIRFNAFVVRLRGVDTTQTTQQPFNPFPRAPR